VPRFTVTVPWAGDQEGDRRLRTTGAIGLDVGVDAGYVTLPCRLPMRRRRRKAHTSGGNQPASVHSRRAALSTGYPRHMSFAGHYHNEVESALACPAASAY
jgi:hypothetical protein